MEAYHKTLTDHHHFAKSQSKHVQRMFDDGVNTMKDTLSAVQQLVEAGKDPKAFEEKGAPALENAVKQSGLNAKWG
jgi:hypothetical protein